MDRLTENPDRDRRICGGPLFVRDSKRTEQTAKRQEEINDKSGYTKLLELLIKYKIEE